jgi:hypothetical protein
VRSIHRLLSIAGNVHSGGNILLAEVGRLLRKAGHSDKLARRQRIEDFAARFGVVGKRPLLGEPDLAKHGRALRDLEARGLQERSDFGGDRPARGGHIDLGDLVLLGESGQSQGEEAKSTENIAAGHGAAS